MSNKHRKPQLRFSEFTDSYKEFRLSDFLSRSSENNKDEEFSIDDILSLSSQYGIVSRKELLDELYSKVNYKNYLKTRLNDFVYGKSISSNCPYGLFKVNDFRDGLLSTLYYTFKVANNISPKYLDFYFSLHTRANNYLKKYVLVGDRYINADSNYILSGKIYLPPKNEEQKKIARFLVQIDKRIWLLKEKKKTLDNYKKGITQKIFSQQIRFKDANGKKFPNWANKKFSELTYKVGDRNKENKKLPIYSINNKEGFVPQSDQFEGMDSNKRGYDIGLYKIITHNTFAYNPARINVGSIGYSGNLNNIIISSLYVCFKTTDIVYDKFFMQYFKTTNFNKAVSSNVEGGVRTYLFYENFSNINLALPSYKEQKKIADFLDLLDKKINHTQTQLEKTELYKKGLLQKMFC